MSTNAWTTHGTRSRPSRQDSSAGNVTRSVLGYLALAGPFYVVVSLAQALTRHGFDLARDEWSLLALGRLGWIQQANLILTGVMIIVGAVGARRAIGRFADAGTWAPRLLAGYGLGLIGAGIFRADAADRFPPGTPSGRAAHVSGHGMLHLLFGSLGFACLIAACLVIARSYHRRADRRGAVASGVVGFVFAVGFAGIATGAASEAINLGFTAAVIISSAWLTAVAIDLYRRTRAADAGRRALTRPVPQPAMEMKERRQG
jgi:Protein of unknown function (DUF998)